GVRSLAEAERDAGLLEHLHGIRSRGHVGPLRDRDAAALHEGFGVVAVELVLRGGGEGELARHGPDVAVLQVPRTTAAAVGVDGDARPLALLHLLQQFEVDALLVVDVAVRVRACHHAGTELLELLDRVDRDVARSGDHAGLALELLAALLQHLAHEVDGPVAGGLLADDGAAPAEALARQHAGLVLPRDPLVHAEEVTDLSAPRADVPGRDIPVLAEVARQLEHEALAEAHDLGLGPPSRVEVGAALAAADRQTG